VVIIRNNRPRKIKRTEPLNAAIESSEVTLIPPNPRSVPTKQTTLVFVEQLDGFVLNKT
jgi:hypothetical protein